MISEEDPSVYRTVRMEKLKTGVRFHIQNGLGERARTFMTYQPLRGLRELMPAEYRTEEAASGDTEQAVGSD